MQLSGFLPTLSSLNSGSCQYFVLLHWTFNCWTMQRWWVLTVLVQRRCRETQKVNCCSCRSQMKRHYIQFTTKTNSNSKGQKSELIAEACDRFDWEENRDMKDEKKTKLPPNCSTRKKTPWAEYSLFPPGRKNPLTSGFLSAMEKRSICSHIWNRTTSKNSHIFSINQLQIWSAPQMEASCWEIIRKSRVVAESGSKTSIKLQLVTINRSYLLDPSLYSDCTMIVRNPTPLAAPTALILFAKIKPKIN